MCVGTCVGTCVDTCVDMYACMHRLKKTPSNVLNDGLHAQRRKGGRCKVIEKTSDIKVAQPVEPSRL